MKPLLLTPGDPQGIGPEVSVKALVEAAFERPVVMIGDVQAIEEQERLWGATITRIDHVEQARPGEVFLLEPPPGPERVELRAIRLATQLLLDKRAGALTTGPIHKGRLIHSGFAFTGHTDFLGHLCGVDRPVMAFVGGQLKVALVTVHLPLQRVPQALSPGLIEHTLTTAHEALTSQLGLDAPQLLLCGLNPHAGDDGTLGTEEIDLITPAADAARAKGLDVIGPISAENAFRKAMLGQGDMVIAMYHDQGLAPLKVVDFGQSVNWTIGLPIIRTSVDHGTADEIAGQGIADASSMVAALRLADSLLG